MGAFGSCLLTPNNTRISFETYIMHHSLLGRMSRVKNSTSRRFAQRRLEMESLEGRALLATFTPYAVTTGPKPTSITAGPNGTLWFAQPGSGSFATSPSYIGTITTSGTITEFPLPAGDEAQFLAAGGDGNMWFTDPSK